ncbi:MAG: efflux RND transporter permease subunit, partial [Planctomycetales bacterium]|nr:efflux RND transporter permease subunit [Planctomycetales bacterium]
MVMLPCHLAHAGGENWIQRCMRRYAALPIWAQLLGSLITSATIVVILRALAMGDHANPGVAALLLIGLSPFVLLTLSFPILQLGVFTHFVRDQNSRLLDWVIAHVYGPHLAWSIRNPLLVLCCCFAFFFASTSLVILGITPWDVFPKMDSNQIEARVSYPDGTPQHITSAATIRLQESLAKVDELYREQFGTSVVRNRRRSVGQVRNPEGLGPEALNNGSHLGSVEVELAPAGQRMVKSQELLDQWREIAGEFPGAESVTFSAPSMGPGGTAIEFKLLADKDHMAELEHAVEECKLKLQEYAGVVDIRDDSRPGKWEYQLRVKPKAQALGISQADLAQTVRASYFGEEVMRLQRGRHEVKLMVRYPQEERNALRNFEEIRIRPTPGVNSLEFPLTELAEVNIERGYSEINRIDQMRSITVTADVQTAIGNAQNTIADMQGTFLSQLLAEHPHVVIRWEGQQEQTNESVHSMFVGFCLALVAMFALLTVEFRSYVQPLIILGIIPFGIVGAILGHAVMGLPITLFTMFGLVALTGVVVNDSIVLIDFINKRYRDGLPLLEAIEDAGRRRLRPVLLTSVTTIAGLTPMLMETSFQAQFLIPLAATLVFGLLVATGLVLILIPTYYVVYRRTLEFFGVTHREPGGEDHTPALTVVDRDERKLAPAESAAKYHADSQGNGNRDGTSVYETERVT